MGNSFPKKDKKKKINSNFFDHWISGSVNFQEVYKLSKGIIGCGFSGLVYKAKLKSNP